MLVCVYVCAYVAMYGHTCVCACKHGERLDRCVICCVHVWQVCDMYVPLCMCDRCVHAIIEVRLDHFIICFVCMQNHRVSVRCISTQGQSKDAQCTMVIGRDVLPVPSDLRVFDVTQNSGVISWLPGNSNCPHAILLNGHEVHVTKPGVSQHMLTGTWSLCCSVGYGDVLHFCGHDVKGSIWHTHQRNSKMKMFEMCHNVPLVKLFK